MKDEDHKALCPEDPVSSKVFMDMILGRFNIDVSSEKSQLSANWKLVSGEPFCNLCSFKSLDNGVLTVICSHPTQAAAVRMYRSELIKNIKGVFPDLDINKVVVSTYR